MEPLKKLKPTKRDSLPIGNTKGKRPNACKKWFFTLNNYTKKDIKNLREDLALISRYIFQSEISSKGTKHLQGCVYFHKKKRPMESILNKRIHWEKCRFWHRAVKYCQKNVSFDYDANIRVSNFTDINDIPKTIKTLYAWQAKLKKELLEDSNDRKVIYYVDKEGKKGKTAFCRYMLLRYDFVAYVLGRLKDVAYYVSNAKKEYRIFLIDVPRCNGNIDYNVVESLKSGIIFSSKYKSSQIILTNYPHVVIFSNFEPDIRELSKDRWDIRKL